ncbi:MAG: hypothetical protein ACFFB3_05050 [Candidatus Hodarchaeota archaeon]
MVSVEPQTEEVHAGPTSEIVRRYPDRNLNRTNVNSNMVVIHAKIHRCRFAAIGFNKRIKFIVDFPWIL